MIAYPSAWWTAATWEIKPRSVHDLTRIQRSSRRIPPHR